MEQQFINACKKGDLELAQQLFHNNTIDISANNEVAFRYSCLYGHLHVAQWLLSVKPDINISAKNENAFRVACLFGHLQVAQWLLYVKPNINISAEDEDAFRFACSEGHLNVAQWLLSVKPDINISAKNEQAFRYTCSAINNFAFRWTCSSGHLHVAQWLQTFKPHLYVINYNEDGTYKSYRIRTKEEEQRFIQRINALWLASDTTPNKNNILYRLPQDVSRLIISYI